MYLSVIFILTLIIPFLVMPKHIKLGILPPYRVVLLSTIGVCVMAVVILMMASLTGQGVYAQLMEVAKLISEDAATNPIFKEMLGAADINNAELSSTILQLYSRGFLFVPVTIMLMAAIVSYIAYIILSRIIGKNNEVKRMPKFREFTFPHGAAMAVMLMYVIGWVMMDSEAQVGEMLYANFSLLFDLVFVLQGIAVVMMFFHLKKIPQVVAVIACIFMCITSFGKTFMVLLGMADLFIGLRIRMGNKPSRM